MGLLCHFCLRLLTDVQSSAESCTVDLLSINIWRTDSLLAMQQQLTWWLMFCRNLYAFSTKCDFELWNLFTYYDYFDLWWFTIVVFLYWAYSRIVCMISRVCISAIKTLRIQKLIDMLISEFLYFLMISAVAAIASILHIIYMLIMHIVGNCNVESES